MTYIIYGDPIPLARARCGKGNIYDSQKDLKLLIGLQLKKQHGNKPFYAGPLSLNATFYLPLPKSRKMFGGYHHIKPDLSNLLKFIEDVATGICYKDDAQISETHIKKVYMDPQGPRTEFNLSELNYG